MVLALYERAQTGALVWDDISREMHRVSTTWRRSSLVRQDRNIVENKVTLIWPDHKLETEKRVMSVDGNQKDPQRILLRAISRVSHCGLFNFPTNRNNDRSNVPTQYKT